MAATTKLGRLKEVQKKKCAGSATATQVAAAKKAAKLEAKRKADTAKKIAAKKLKEELAAIDKVTSTCSVSGTKKRKAAPKKKTATKRKSTTTKRK